MKKTTKNDKAQKRNDEAAKILRALDDRELSEVSGGYRILPPPWPPQCPTCGILHTVN